MLPLREQAAALEFVCVFVCIYSYICERERERAIELVLYLTRRAGILKFPLHARIPVGGVQLSSYHHHMNFFT